MVFRIAHNKILKPYLRLQMQGARRKAYVCTPPTSNAAAGDLGKAL
jgi:hypothetical protein